MTIKNQKFTFSPPQKVWMHPAAAVARWQGGDAQWGYIYADRKCSCIISKQGKTCEHVMEYELWIEEEKADAIVENFAGFVWANDCRLQDAGDQPLYEGDGVRKMKDNGEAW